MADRLSADTAAGWARLLGDGGAVSEACMRRELASWNAGLCGQESTPLVKAAVDAAGVAWLTQRYAEREVFTTGEKKRATAVRQLEMANRQVQEAITLVLAARAASRAVADRVTGGHHVATGPGCWAGRRDDLGPGGADS